VEGELERLRGVIERVAKRIGRGIGSELRGEV